MLQLTKIFNTIYGIKDTYKLTNLGTEKVRLVKCALLFKSKSRKINITKFKHNFTTARFVIEFA